MKRWLLVLIAAIAAVDTLFGAGGDVPKLDKKFDTYFKNQKIKNIDQFLMALKPQLPANLKKIITADCLKTKVGSLGMHTKELYILDNPCEGGGAILKATTDSKEAKRLNDLKTGPLGSLINPSPALTDQFNLMGLLYAVKQGKVFYLFLEKAPGQPFAKIAEEYEKQYTATPGSRPGLTSRVQELSFKIGQLMSRFHRKFKMAHNDLGGDNLFIDEQNRIYVIDFSSIKKSAFDADIRKGFYRLVTKYKKVSPQQWIEVYLKSFINGYLSELNGTAKSETLKKLRKALLAKVLIDSKTKYGKAELYNPILYVKAQTVVKKFLDTLK